uniref:Uncharacterized protein n=1 Tax=Arundo donax TaxID=35708 RepID=A0A0A9A3D1_ARUDO
MKWERSVTRSRLSQPSGRPCAGPGKASSAKSTASPAAPAWYRAARLRAAVTGATAGEEARQVQHGKHVALRQERHQHEVERRLHGSATAVALLDNYALFSCL